MKVFLSVVVLLLIVVAMKIFVFTYSDLLCFPSKLNKSSLTKLVNIALKEGDSRDVIESFFDNSDIPFSYDKYLRRYQTAISMDCKLESNNFRTLVMHINLDSDSTFQEAEISYSFK